MINPKILSKYTYRVAYCQTHPADAVMECSDYFRINSHALAAWLRTIGAVGAHRLATI